MLQAHIPDRIINARLSLLLLQGLLFLLLSFHSSASDHPSPLERFDSTLVVNIQSVDELIAVTDRLYGKENRQSLRYAEGVDSLIQWRFVHSYCHYTAKENWLAFLAGSMVWSDLSAIVIPGDILRHPTAACSQQSIVFCAAMKAIGINYRAIRLRSHFALEANLDGKWFYFDPTFEPRFPEGRKSLELLIQNGEIETAYQHRFGAEPIRRYFSKINYGVPNEHFAYFTSWFHLITRTISWVLPLSLPFFLLHLLRKKRRTKYADVHTR